MNIGSLLTHSAQTFPDQPALIQGERRLSYAEFNARANRLANALGGLGVGQGDNIALLMYNCTEMLEALFAGFKAGCGVVPINFRLHPNEFSYIIDHSESKAVIVSPEFNQPIAEMRDQMPRIEHRITLSDPGDGFLDYESVLSSGGDVFKDVDVAPDDVAWFFYTSGTTGMPKGAMLTHRNLMAMTMSFYADMCPGFGTHEAVLHAAPLSHGSGLYALPNIGKAAMNIIPEDRTFDPQKVFEAIQEHRITNFFAAPTMVKRLVESSAVDSCDHSSLKAVIYGGGPMLVDDLLVAIEKLGPCLVQLYGQGESPMTISYLPQEDHVLDGDADQMRRLASAGYAHVNVEVKIFDANDNELPAGETGEIVTRSDLVMKGYWRNPEATAETLRNGWLHTGDMGCFDAQGYLFIMDRSKDMIISGGENIYPREIEEVVIQHPAVREVAVIGVPDPEWGEAVKAVVALNDGQSTTEQELINFCKDHIASFKKPKSVDFIDEIPKNNYGKIVKRELRDKYGKGKGKSVV